MRIDFEKAFENANFEKAKRKIVGLKTEHWEAFRKKNDKRRSDRTNDIILKKIRTTNNVYKFIQSIYIAHKHCCAFAFTNSLLHISNFHQIAFAIQLYSKRSGLGILFFANTSF